MILNIENLFLTKNAMFYENKNLVNTNEIIEELLDKASSNKNEKEFILNELNKESKIDNLNYKYSSRVYQISRPVHFIKDKEVFELIFAYIFIIEIQNYIVIFSKNISSISKELREQFNLVKNLDFAHTLSDNTEYQRLALRNMTISDKDIRNRSYEAQNLNGILSLHTAGRAIPSYIKVKDKDRKLSLSSTGRIVENSERNNIKSLVVWAKNQIELLQDKNTYNSFINNFAKNVELDEILENNELSAVLLEYNAIYDHIESIDSSIFKKLKNGKYKRICDRRKNILFNNLEEIYETDENGDHSQTKSKIRINKKGLSIQSPQLKNFYIQENNKFISLQELINKQKLFSVTFTDPKYMYFMGNCFQNNSNISEINNILDSLEIFPDMNNIISEKGKVTNKSSKFQNTSLFDLVEKIHAKDHYIFCDDLGDEWADHITINKKTNCVSFIHSKHKSVSSSASNLHDVTGQAIKNLGNMHFSKEKFLEKIPKFNQNYADSKISRVRKGNLNNLDSDLDYLLKQHTLHKKCIIACTFLSKKEMEDEFNKLTIGQKVKGNIVQLLWILSSFIHAAKESSIIPIIYCQP
ncbi:hypothetical protein [Actinobacillus equuli]|uniref:hypothetical protein n=1 Tax=Actinobacillus equuli TaxID=718 RepID=UPI002442E976|nr:hypothetical protein [Actinobacillus equuli]WGE64970.1 hypothetical protein NYR76_08855 [Actinobacillus equuli subsp. equuli]WGE78952.1 hypothetical protein NYR83_08660 [Actinobacillus equuli subsp. equuli]